MGGRTPDMSDLYANWAQVYDYFYPDRGDEVAFWARLAEPYGEWVLDLMCGTAEISLGLTRHGYRVVGVDRSAEMLAVAGERLAVAADYPARGLSLVQGDAVAIPLSDWSADFGLVGGNGSFNHLEDGPALAALRQLCRVLRPGGGLGMELVNPYLLKEVYPKRTFSPLRPTPPGLRVEKMLANRYDRKEGLFHIRQKTRYEKDGGCAEFEEVFALRVRELDEVRALLETVGFKDIRFCGDYDLGPFDCWSSDLLVFARTPLGPR
jgi:SAM-dependent methyltransferase